MLWRNSISNHAAAMIAETSFETKPPPAAPDLSKFDDRDFTEGVEIDEDQEWIGELLAERVRQIDAGEMKTYSLEDTMQWLDELKGTPVREQA